MTLFSPRYMTVSGELKSSRSRAASKRTSNGTYRSDADLDYDCYHDDYYDRVYDTQRVPASLSPVSQEASSAKRPRSSCYSSRHRHSRDRSHSKCSKPHSSSSNTAKLGMEELQVIKKELTLIKTQIDGLLDSLDRMDTQRTEHKGSPRERTVQLALSTLHRPAAQNTPAPHCPLPTAIGSTGRAPS
ncbi:hypothetical protein WMY93_013257 [Mugilogobius chulae]|uniref:Uncharacterized protein n=1 Tax=Mugilogobius chulae TaxID=88201 RepID=A0AAW0P5V0_9GOBI